MYYLEAGYGKHNRLRNAVLLALALHAALLLGLSFSPGDGKAGYNPQIEVTLALQPASKAPDKAVRIAQADQRGDDEPEDVPEAPPPQAVVRPKDARGDPRRDVLTTSAAARRAVEAEQLEQQQAMPMTGISPEVDELSRELASLEAQLDQQAQSYANMPRVRRLTSVSAKQSADAAYLLDWRRRVEAVGNKYYPEASIRYGIYGSLRLLVVINHDGSLEDIRVLSSSGYAVLDEAAIKIVRMAAPYTPFPAELRATTDQLEIIRTWQFRENRLSSK
jgi:periplasmic protein TonB